MSTEKKLKKTKTTVLEYEQAEKFLRKELLQFQKDYPGKLTEFASRNTLNYTILLELKNDNLKSKQVPNFIEDCLIALGYPDVKLKKVIYYTFDKNKKVDPPYLNTIDYEG